jgi:hypothetical protein
MNEEEIGNRTLDQAPGWRVYSAGNSLEDPLCSGLAGRQGMARWASGRGAFLEWRLESTRFKMHDVRQGQGRQAMEEARSRQALAKRDPARRGNSASRPEWPRV